MRVPNYYTPWSVAASNAVVRGLILVVAALLVAAVSLFLSVVL